MILAADIGGTNCRLGLFRRGPDGLVMERDVWLNTTDVKHTAAFLEAIETKLGCPPCEADIVVAAIAGPVEGKKGKLVNGTLELDFSSLNATRTHFWIINDFLAQAWAVSSPYSQTAQLIWGERNNSHQAARAVIGAGTGLGQAALAPITTPNRPAYWQPLASEFGHAAFPFVTWDEMRFQQFLCQKLGIAYASGDQVVAGSGLALLHEFLTGKALAPAEVGRIALSSDTETLVWYSRFYARACRHWMLATLCTGGLWIAGGVAAKNPYCVQNRYFHEELLASPKWENFLSSTPVYLISDKNSGLWGGAFFGEHVEPHAGR